MWGQRHARRLQERGGARTAAQRNQGLAVDGALPGGLLGGERVQPPATGSGKHDGSVWGPGRRPQLFAVHAHDGRSVAYTGVD